MLAFGPWWTHHDEWQPLAHAQPFPTISTLKALKTLYMQSPSIMQIYQHADLSGCEHLQCVAVQNVQLCRSIHLPAGCALHAAGGILSLDTFISHIPCSRVTVHRKIRMKLELWYHKCLQEHYRCLAPSMHNLRQLRLILRKGNLKEQHMHTDRVKEDISFGPDSTPCLEVLELDAPCSMTVSIDPKLPLRLVAIVAADTLQSRKSLKPYRAPTATLKQVHLQSGALMLPSCRAVPQSSYVAESWAGVRLRDYVREEHDKWTARMPASFQPSSLQQCCCAACPECPARAAVSILCHKAWTSNGFEEHLRPCCSVSP